MPELGIVDARRLEKRYRDALRPGATLCDAEGRAHQLPRYFYEVPSWNEAKQFKLTANFTLAELILVDCREARALFRQAPLFVPCAVTILARYLQEFRNRAEAPVFISANGGYRSPAHQWDRSPPDGRVSSHHWAAAADIYRVGDTWLDSQEPIERYARLAQGIGPEVFVRAFGLGPGETDDHLHLDLGFLTVIPHGWSEA
jgi:hypothetical protein